MHGADDARERPRASRRRAGDDAVARALAPESRFGLWTLAIALALIGAPLTVIPAQTETAFAWTIEPPLTAAWLGACYWGSCVLVLLSVRRAAWTHARLVVPGILVAGVFLLASTLIHLDRFHMDDVTGWTWVVLYSLLPPGAVALVVRQGPVAGRDAPPTAPMAPWAVAALVVLGGVMLGAGAALFAVPVDAAPAWPWDLTPLTARATGAWLMAIGASVAQAALEADRDRTRAGLIGFAAIAALWLVAFARFPDAVRWGDPSAWALAAVAAALLAGGVAAAAGGRAPALGADLGTARR